MSNTKDKHYWTQLRAALTAGSWASVSPGRAPNGTPLSWSELLRKFNKHCKGYADVAEIASQTQAVSLLLAARAGSSLKENDLDGDEPPASQGPLALGDECVLPQERIDEARSGNHALQRLNASNADSLKFALAYYAYALGRPEDCLSILSEIPNVPDVHARIPTISSMRTTTTTTTASTLIVPGQSVPGRSETPSSIRTTTSLTSFDASPAALDIADGKAWSATETVRSICLQGMSLERLHPSEPRKALDAYLVALPILSSIVSELPRPSPPSTAPAGPGKLDFASFNRYRELWRWSERLLWRAIVLSSRRGVGADTDSDDGTEEGADATLWRAFDNYRACSTHWPPTFRTHHRGTVAVLHIRAFILRARDGGWEGLGGSLATLSPLVPPTRPAPWTASARSVIQEYRAVLGASTSFPRAGEHNTRVEELVDLSVAVWEEGGAVGEYAGWVVDILWWATRLTFHSHRIYRHMSRLLYVSGDAELAKRFLRLYVQVVGKAREASAAEDTANAERTAADLGVDEHEDSDEHWVRTLAQGARMLCRSALAADGATGLEDAREAGLMIERARTRLDPQDRHLTASVLLADGIWHSVIAIKEQEPRTRMTRLSKGLELLRQSAETVGTASAYHHLALAHLRPGPAHDLNKAIEYAGRAVEMAHGDVRHWHLLALLEAATGDWKKARSVLEVGAAIGEAEIAHESGAAAPGQSPSGVLAKDFATGEETGRRRQDGDVEGSEESFENVQLPRSYLLAADTTTIPPAATLLLPLPDHPPPSQQELFEYSLQLRITQLALAEYIGGPEGVQDHWTDVFSWFSQKRGSRESNSITPQNGMEDDSPIVDRRRNSFDGGRSITEKPESMLQVPINVMPATPNEGVAFPSDGEGIDKLVSSMVDEGPGRDSSSLSGNKVQRMVKNSVTKGQARINTISRKIGHGVARTGSVSLQRSRSVPDLENGDQPAFQASSIHSRRYYTPSIVHRHAPSIQEKPPPPPPMPASPQSASGKRDARSARDRRLLSDLWAMSAATFRRLGKIEQARAAIQESEVTDENNPAVWVQLALYYAAHTNDRRATDALNKALFIAPEDVPATVHLCRLHLEAVEAAMSSAAAKTGAKVDDAEALPLLSGAQRGQVDLAAGMLAEATRGAGWDVPEAWFFLAKAYGLQGRRDRARECLLFALELAEGRGVREVGAAVGWCL